VSGIWPESGQLSEIRPDPGQRDSATSVRYGVLGRVAARGTRCERCAWLPTAGSPTRARLDDAELGDEASDVVAEAEALEPEPLSDAHYYPDGDTPGYSEDEL
jgi:hypothetical protein